MAERDSSSPPPAQPSATEARTNRDSIKKGFNDIMKFADINFTRAKQFMTEKAGKAEAVTEFDKEFESLCDQMDQIKLVTESMLAQMETLMQPNPNVRLEDWARTKLDRPKPARQNSFNLLGTELTKASEAFGQQTQYGSYLMHCGQVEAQIGESKKRFEDKVMKDVITPLKAFMEIDIKNIIRERKNLNVKRLDLDARKASHKKAQGDKVAMTEMAVREAQSEYDFQLEKVRKSLQKVVDTHVNNMGYLRSFMSAQKAFYAECQAYLGDIESGSLMSQSLLTSARNSSFKEEEEEGKFTAGGYELERGESRRARMLYDYDAVNDDELSLNASAMFVATPIPGDGEFVMAEFNGRTGKVPSTYLEYV